MITNLLSYANIYNFLLNNAKIFYDKTKLLIDYLLNYWKTKYKIRNKIFRSNNGLILCILFLLFFLLINKQSNSKKPTFNKEIDIQLFINRIRDIVIIDQNFLFNITYYLTFNNIPKWLNQYGIAHLFNFYWLQNGAYLWHLQRMIDFKKKSINTTTNFHQIFPENQTNISDYLNHHPEYGIIIDTSSDPIQSLFPPLPQSSLPSDKTCEYYPWLNDWYPCKQRISSLSLKPLITYALYDVTIGKYSTNLKINYYDEIIYLFDYKQQLTNETYFVRQILPRLIRLLALVPQTSLILLPYLNTTGYFSQYIDVLIERGLINDRKRFIKYNSTEIYQSNVIYSTSSPRSDIILLNKILIGNKPPIRREFILVIRNNFDDYSYNQIIQAITQFEFPADFEYLHIHEYHEQSYDLKQISHIFQHARIVIGMSTDILSHIVWCLPRTHIIEIIQQTMTTDYYEISLQLHFNYWLAMINENNQIDIIDFRNLMMKVLTDIDA